MRAILEAVGAPVEESVWSRGPEQTPANRDGTHGFPAGRGRHLAVRHRAARAQVAGRAAGLDLLASLQLGGSTPPGSPMRGAIGAFDDAAGGFGGESAGLYMLKHALAYLPTRLSAVHGRCFTVSTAFSEIVASDLRTLDTRGVNVSVSAVESIMRRCRRLKTINLYGCRLGPRGIDRLITSLPACRVQELGLGGNAIGDEGVQAIASVLPHCSDLRLLDLRWNAIGDAGGRALAAALPTCPYMTKSKKDFTLHAQCTLRLALPPSLSLARARALSLSPSFSPHARALIHPSHPLTALSLSLFLSLVGT